MNWKQYQNELIVLVAFLVMFGAYIYKHNHITTQVTGAQSAKHSLEELKNVVSLQKIWADKKIGKKVDKLETLISASKVKWSKKSEKVTATYTGLSSNELNKLITKILNAPIQIRLLDVQKNGSSYNVEFKCKW